MSDTPAEHSTYTTRVFDLRRGEWLDGEFIVPILPPEPVMCRHGWDYMGGLPRFFMIIGNNSTEIECSRAEADLLGRLAQWFCDRIPVEPR